jgi:hypothetical protein
MNWSGSTNVAVVSLLWVFLFFTTVPEIYFTTAREPFASSKAGAFVGKRRIDAGNAIL